MMSERIKRPVVGRDIDPEDFKVPTAEDFEALRIEILIMISLFACTLIFAIHNIIRFVLY